MIDELLSKIKEHGIILSIYTILSIILTYPVAFSKNEIPGGGDAYLFLWAFWWIKKALLSLSNPFYTTYEFYPDGVSLAFTTLSLFNAIVSVPMQSIFGLTGSYNILWICTFILSGFGTFLLVKYLTEDRMASFISGLIFAFCPYHFAHALGHMNLTTMQWIPFYVLFLIKTLRENRLSNSIYGSMFLFFTALSDYHYLVFAMGFTILYLIYYELIEKDLFRINTLRKIGLMALFFGLAIAPFIFPMIRELLNAKSGYIYAGGFSDYSADLLGFFIPSQFHPFFRNLALPIYANFSGNVGEYTVFIGYTVMALSIIAYIKDKSKETRFWTSSVLIFLVLSLGPVLHINGVTNITLKGHEIYLPLPYAVLMHIPLISIARVPSRWDVLVVLSFAVLSGYGLKYIFNCIGKNRPFLFVIITLLILFEFLAIPYPMSSARVPNFYSQIANENEDYAILELPYNQYLYTNLYIYYQTLHQKRLVNGAVSRTPRSIEEFLSQTPFIGQLTGSSIMPSIDEITGQNITEQGQLILNYYHIKYILLHDNNLLKNQSSSLIDFLESIPKEKLFVDQYMTKEESNSAKTLLKSGIVESATSYENGSMIVYKIKEQPLRPFITLQSGWYGLENWGKPTRWMNDEAVIRVYSDGNKSLNLSLTAISFHRPRTLEIYANNNMLIRETVATGFRTLATPIQLEKGGTLIRLHVSEGCERPIDIKELDDDDSRCLSMAIQNITISPSG